MNKDMRCCGFVAILGAPNSGKSTLVNAMVGAKVSIVSPKVQTTRSRIVGVSIIEESQLILLDTPGIFQPKRRLEKAMVAAAWGGARDADILLVLVDSRRTPNSLNDDTVKIIDGLRRTGRKAILILNKIDLVKRTSLLALTESLVGNQSLFHETFMISALNGDGIEDLKSHLASLVPAGPWLYPEDQLTDVPMRFLALEITREKLFLALHDELPYALMVEHVNWQENADGAIRIDQNIIVARENHKPIVIGKGGALIKSIGVSSRTEIEKIIGTRVHLFLRVKVRESWLEEPRRYTEMGLIFPGDS